MYEVIVSFAKNAVTINISSPSEPEKKTITEPTSKPLDIPAEDLEKLNKGKLITLHH